MWFMTNLRMHHFPKKNESVQYYVVLAITGAIKGSSRESLYQELGVEYLYRRRWARRLYLLYKVFLKLKFSSFKKQKQICNTRTITSEKQFFHKIINFCIGPLRVPWGSLVVSLVGFTLGPLGNLQGTSLGRRVPAGCFLW